MLDAFGRHSEDDLDEVDVLGAAPTVLERDWRRERATVELRPGTVVLVRRKLR